MSKLSDFELRPGDWVQRGENLYVMCDNMGCILLSRPHHGTWCFEECDAAYRPSYEVSAYSNQGHGHYVW